MTTPRRANWQQRLKNGRLSRTRATTLARKMCVLAFWFALGQSLYAAGDRTAAIESVTLSKPFFNPTLNQTIRIDLSVRSAGRLSIVVLDRDGYPVRKLVDRHPVTPGKVAFDWNGRDDLGNVVPDEAYSLKIDLTSEHGASSYFPAKSPAEEVKAEIGYYDRRTAVLSYRLSSASRVHIQAGLAGTDKKTGEQTGPVLRTIVNREPRPAGADIETWNGLDETGSYYVPDLPGFVMAIAATGLPENSIVTVGNRSITFVEWARRRKGESLLRPATADHSHHKGLSVFDDLSPLLAVQTSNAKRSGEGNAWRVDGASLRGSLTLVGPTSTQFAKHPGALLIFLDERKVLVEKSPSNGMAFEIPLAGLTPGDHIVAFDWISEYGPVAVTSLLIEVPERPARVATKAGSHE